MKYTARVCIGLTTFLLGTGAFLLATRTWSDASGLGDQIPPVNITDKVTLRFLNCAGTRSVFLLENSTEHPIYARVDRADFWKEFKDANLEFGVHLIAYKSSGSKDFEDASPVWDAVLPFQTIMPHATVRYGVDLWKGPGEYRVKIPYMDDVEMARRLDEDFGTIIKQESQPVKASWSEASSDIVSNSCH